MDVRNMRFPTNHFDLIIDKSTIDALLCGDSSFMNTAIMMKVKKLRITLQECQRILKLDGVYMGISYGTPENRLVHYKRGHLKLNVSTFQVAQPHPNGNQTIHYVYMCRKLEGADELCYPKILVGRLGCTPILEYANFNFCNNRTCAGNEIPNVWTGKGVPACTCPF